MHFAAQQVDADHELGIIVKDKGNSLQEVHLGNGCVFQSHCMPWLQGFQKIKNSYKCMLFTTKLFVANLLKHLRSCQFTG